MKETWCSRCIAVAVAAVPLKGSPFFQWCMSEKTENDAGAWVLALPACRTTLLCLPGGIPGLPRAGTAPPSPRPSGPSPGPARALPARGSASEHSSLGSPVGKRLLRRYTKATASIFFIPNVS